MPYCKYCSDYFEPEEADNEYWFEFCTESCYDEYKLEEEADKLMEEGCI
jgi:hypothetical protein